jgi:hypothetical protein
VNGIRVRRLRLVGLFRNYEVSFLHDDGSIRALAIIAGEIATGKTSILEFITYCLGAADFPHHQEIRQSVRSALLECEVDDISYVIERSCVENSSRTAVIHSCVLDTIEHAHPQRDVTILPPSDRASLSYFLLSALGVAEVQLREAPTQSASGTDSLSIRDVLRVVYVQHHQLDNRSLLLESAMPVVRLKHEQLIDLLFGAHDNRAVSVAAEVKRVESEIDHLQTRLEAIVAFLSEQRVPDEDVLNERKQGIEMAFQASRSALSEVEQRMAAVASFGDQQRRAHQVASERASRALNVRRNVSTQIERLTALAAQYDQDVKKLTFANEAQLLFDPLTITVCPWCLQAIEVPAPDGGACSICHQSLTEPDVTDDGTFKVDRELRAVKKRQGELAMLLNELYTQADEAESTQREAIAEAERSQAALDEVMRSRFAPFINQRDALLSKMAEAEEERRVIGQRLGMQEAATRRKVEVGALRQQLFELVSTQRGLANGSISRSDVVSDLSQRFSEILAEFHFPKLSDAHLDGRYVPHVRGVPYSQLGSAGATTLVSLAWFLTIFERSVEQGGPHPGLLLIDSPQKNLLALAGQKPDEFQGASIATGVYDHFIRWASGGGSNSQIIIVDNAPQPTADDNIVVRYTGDPARPPYGLIVDAVE